MKKNQRTYYPILIIALAVLILALNVIGILLKDQDFSALENRNLQTKPDLSWHEAVSGRFEDEYEDYLADQFPFRGTWVRLKTMTDRLMGRNESNGIYLGRDGYLIQRFNQPSQEQLDNTLGAIRSFAERHSDLQHYALIAPTAVSVLKDHLPLGAVTDDEDAFLNSLSYALPENVIMVDVRDALKNAAKNRQVYYRTDHHWTTDGAYEAYLELAEKASLPGKDVVYDRLLISDSFSGTLTASSGFRLDQTDDMYVYLTTDTLSEYMVYYAEEEEISMSFFKTDNLSKRDQYTLFLNGNHPVVNIQTNSDSERKLLVFKDSYANCFIPFMAEDFCQIVMVDPRYYSEDIESLVTSTGFTDVLYLFNAETFAEDRDLKDILAGDGTSAVVSETVTDPDAETESQEISSDEEIEESGEESYDEESYDEEY